MKPGTPAIPQRLAADPGEGSTWRRLARGMGAAGSGFGYALRHTDVLLVALGAMLLYGTVWAAFLWLAARYDAQVAHAVLGTPGPAWWQEALWHVARVLVYAAFWLAALLLSATVAMPLLAPVFSLLADRVEARWYGAGAPWPGLGVLALEAARGLGRGLLLLALQVSGGFVLWTLGWLIGMVVPPLGALLGVIASATWNAFWFAAMATSFALENNRVPLRAQLGFLQANVATLLGFGLIAQVCAWVPFTVPLLVVGATLLVCRLHDHGRCHLPVREALSGRGRHAGVPQGHC